MIPLYPPDPSGIGHLLDAGFGVDVEHSEFTVHAFQTHTFFFFEKITLKFIAWKLQESEGSISDVREDLKHFCAWFIWYKSESLLTAVFSAVQSSYDFHCNAWWCIFVFLDSHCCSASVRIHGKRVPLLPRRYPRLLWHYFLNESFHALLRLPARTLFLTHTSPVRSLLLHRHKAHNFYFLCKRLRKSSIT